MTTTEKARQQAAALAGDRAQRVDPLGNVLREHNYRMQNGDRPFTPAQRRRLRHKGNAMGDRA